MLGLETSLWYSSVFLKCLSFSPISSKASRFRKAANLAHFLFVIVIASSMFLQILIYVIQNPTSFGFITEHVSTQVAFLQLLSKVMMYRINRKKFFRLLKNMNSMVRNGSQGIKTHLQQYGSTCNVVYISYTSTIFILAMDYCLTPLFKSGRELPIVAWYPFDYESCTLFYSIAYFHQISAIILSWLCSGVDVMFGVMVFFCCAQYKAMQEILRKLRNTGDIQLRQDGRVDDFEENIREIVDLHCKVFDSVTDINDIHTYTLFVLFLTSIIMICCAGFQITNVSEQSLNSQLIFSVMVCCVLFELLFYFVPGDVLVNEALAVGMAAYDSNWESMPPRYRKYLLVIMMRSANPPKLEGGRVEPLMLENYASFLTTTLSYFMSLQAITKIE